jgi:glycosyltransferase involved in cell wall biosynthesis
MTGELVKGKDQAKPAASEEERCLAIAFCLPVLRAESEGDTSLLLQMIIARRLATLGHQIRFVAPLDQADVACTTDPERQQVVTRTWTASLPYLVARKAVWKLQKLLGIPYLNTFSNDSFYDAYLRCLPGVDLVQERNGFYRMAAAMACKRLKLPYILFFDGDDLLEQEFLGKKMSKILLWRARQMIRYNLSAADRVICVSEVAKARLINTWQVPEKKIVVFSNGVDTRLYCPDPHNAPLDRAALGYSHEPVIVFVGSFYPWQDVRLLLEAFREVIKEEPQARLLMVGDGKQYQSALRYRDELGLQELVHFTGFLKQEEVFHMLNAADIAVAPYTKMDPAHFIGSPMKLFEYMASGKAVVASAMGQIEDVIEDGQNGFLVPPGDAQALASCLVKLIRDPALRDRTGAQARLDAVRSHSWEDYVLRLEALYRTVIDERSLAKPQFTKESSEHAG